MEIKQLCRLYVGLHVSDKNLETLPEDLLTAYKNMRDIQGKGKANEFLSYKVLRKLKTELVKHVAGFTIISGDGYWEGKHEPSVIVEIIDPECNVIDLCADIKKSCWQDAVLVTYQEIQTYTF